MEENGHRQHNLEEAIEAVVFFGRHQENVNFHKELNKGQGPNTTVKGHHKQEDVAVQENTIRRTQNSSAG